MGHLYPCLWEQCSLKSHINVNVQPGDGGKGERKGQRSLSSFGEEG